MNFHGIFFIQTPQNTWSKFEMGKVYKKLCSFFLEAENPFPYPMSEKNQCYSRQVMVPYVYNNNIARRCLRTIFTLRRLDSYWQFGTDPMTKWHFSNGATISLVMMRVGRSARLLSGGIKIARGSDDFFDWVVPYDRVLYWCWARCNALMKRENLAITIHNRNCTAPPLRYKHFYILTTIK